MRLNRIKIVRVVFDLKGSAGDYTVTKSPDGTSINVNFGTNTVPPTEPEEPDTPIIGENNNGNEGEFDDGLNNVTEIAYKHKENSDVVTIYSEEKPDYDIFTLSNPYRIVIDIDKSIKDITELPDFDDADISRT